MSAAAILKLQAAGFTAEQVTAIAEAVDTQSATKADLETYEHRLGTQVDEVEHRLETKIGEVEHRLETKIGDVEHRLEIKLAEFRAAAKADLDAVDRRLDLKITALQGEIVLLKWMMGFVLAFQLAIFAKLFLH